MSGGKLPVLIFAAAAVIGILSEYDGDPSSIDWTGIAVMVFFVLVVFGSGGSSRGPRKAPVPRRTPKSRAPVPDFEIPPIEGAPGESAQKSAEAHRGGIADEDARQEREKLDRMLKQKNEREARERAVREAESEAYAKAAKLPQGEKKRRMPGGVPLDAAALKKAFVYSEIFGKPKALRGAQKRWPERK